MRAANISALIAAMLWFGLLLMGRSGMTGHISLPQFDFYVLWPAYVLIALLACAWGCNLFRRWYWLLGLVAAASLLTLVPLLFVYTGGV